MSEYRKKLEEAGLIRVRSANRPDVRFTDGALPHAVGVHTYQVMRASADPALSPEGLGFTYNHAAMICWWRNRFFIEYLGGQRSEHVPPSAAFLCVSQDGLHYEPPIELFPQISAPTAPYRGKFSEKLTGERTPCIVHHRMGFFVSKDDRLLALTFYGISPDPSAAPNSGYGVARAVREITLGAGGKVELGPVYFIRYNEAAGYTAEYADSFPFFEASPDEGFRAACRELLGHRLATQQWWEEERLDTTGFFTRPGAQAFCWYTLPDGRIISVFKNRLVSVSSDGGEHWTELEKALSLETSTGKVWGQRTCDGKYALVYDPTTDSQHRWPLAVTVGDNGQDFGDIWAVTTEAPPIRFDGLMKNLGPQYIRGISENNPRPDDGAMWLAYTVNKEDVWTSRVSVPVRGAEEADVEGDLVPGADGLPERWNIFAPAWGDVILKDGALHASERDRYARVVLERAFPASTRCRVEADITVDEVDAEQAVCFSLDDDIGRSPVRLRFRPDGKVCLYAMGRDAELCTYVPGTPVHIDITADCVLCEAEILLSAPGMEARTRAQFSNSCQTLTRAVIASKHTLPFNTVDSSGKFADMGDLPGADTPTGWTRFSLSGFAARCIEK